MVGIAVLVGAVVGWLLMRAVDIAGVHRIAEEDWFPPASTAKPPTARGHRSGCQRPGAGTPARRLRGAGRLRGRPRVPEGVPEALREPIHVVHRSITKVALTAVFLAFGTSSRSTPRWPQLGAGGVLFALWALFLRRLPVVLPAVRLMTRTGWTSSAFIGWSGPMAIPASTTSPSPTGMTQPSTSSCS